MRLCLHSAAGMHEGLGLGPGWRAGGKGDSQGQPGLPGSQHPEREGHMVLVEGFSGGWPTLSSPSWRARQGERGVGQGAWHRPVFLPSVLSPCWEWEGTQGTRSTQTGWGQNGEIRCGCQVGPGVFPGLEGGSEALGPRGYPQGTALGPGPQRSGAREPHVIAKSHSFCANKHCPALSSLYSGRGGR